MKASKIQYAIIPFNFLEKKENTSESNKSSIYKSIKKNLLNNIVITISDDENPYVEELATKNKIGLNKKDNYNIYIPGKILYNICNKKEAYYLAQTKEYKDQITNIFES
jgi:hypothetical protein